MEGDGHCVSNPKTKCQLEFEKGSFKNLKEGLFFFITFAAVVGLIAYMFIYKLSVRSFKTDLWYVVVNSRTGTREYTPVSKEYKNTLIWLHDYNEGVMTSSAHFEHSKFFAKSTKIILPDGPKRDMNYKILGFK